MSNGDCAINSLISIAKFVKTQEISLESPDIYAEKILFASQLLISEQGTPGFSAKMLYSICEELGVLCMTAKSYYNAIC
jgi:hypothetical protein